MNREQTPSNTLSSLRLMAVHAAITLLAVGIAFKLPDAARYILYQWWPRVQDDSQALLLTELGLAGLLVLAFNLMRFTWDCWRKAKANAVASLVHARDTTDGWLSRLVEGKLMRSPPWKRDLLIMAITGHDTFTTESAALHHASKDCHELRVMLLNPAGEGARYRARSLGDPDTVIDRYRSEVAGSVAHLARLHAAGKKVALKLYEDPPFWKLVFAGDEVWVQFCHDGRDTKECPEYAFALQPNRPERGLFPAFFSFFLNHWNDPRHPEYDFETGELVSRNPDGTELRRVPLPRPQTPPGPAQAGGASTLADRRSEGESL